MGVTKQPNLFKGSPLEKLLEQVATMSDTMSDIVCTDFKKSSRQPNSVAVCTTVENKGVISVHSSIIEDPYNLWQCIQRNRDYGNPDIDIIYDRGYSSTPYLVGKSDHDLLISSADLQNKSSWVILSSLQSSFRFQTLKHNAYKCTTHIVTSTLYIWSKNILGIHGYSLNSYTFRDYLPWSRYSENMMYHFNVDPSEINATFRESTYKLIITGNDNVQISSDSDWCTLDITSVQGNGTVTVTVKQNTGPSDRNASITLMSSTQTKHVPVLQFSRAFSGITVNGSFIGADYIPNYPDLDNSAYDNNTHNYALDLGPFVGDLTITVHAKDAIEYIIYSRLVSETEDSEDYYEQAKGTKTFSRNYGSTYAGKSLYFYITFNPDVTSDPYFEIETDNFYYLCKFKVPGSDSPKLSLNVQGEYTYNSLTDTYSLRYTKNVLSWLHLNSRAERTAILVFGYYDLANKVNPYTQSEYPGNPYTGSYSINQQDANNDFIMFTGFASTPESDSVLGLLKARAQEFGIDTSKLKLLSEPCIFFLPTESNIDQSLNNTVTWLNPETSQQAYKYVSNSDSFVYFAQTQFQWRPYPYGITKVPLVYYEFEVTDSDFTALTAATPHNSMVPHFLNINRESVYKSALTTILKQHLNTPNYGLVSHDDLVSLTVLLK